MAVDEPARTVPAQLGDCYTHIHPGSRQARTISIREAARLQSFLDAFERPAGSSGSSPYGRDAQWSRSMRCALDARQRLSPEQDAEIDRVLRSYPELTDDEFVAAHRDEWLA